MTKKIIILLCSFVLFFSLSSCSGDYKDFSSENGRKAAIEQANNYLSQGLCQDAIDVLSPVFHSTYVNNDVRIVMASAYACAGGLELLNFVDALSSIDGDDIWSPIVKSNHSSSGADGKVTNLLQAAEILFDMASDAGNRNAEVRPDDANFFMVFVQASIIGVVISPTDMGNADSTTGKKTANVTGLGGDFEHCRLTVAFAVLTDSLQHINVGSSLSTVSDKIDAACGGSCPTHKDVSTCTSTEYTEGQALLIGIDSTWATN